MVHVNNIMTACTDHMLTADNEAVYSASAEESDDVEKKQKQFKLQRKPSSGLVSREVKTYKDGSPESSDSNEEPQSPLTTTICPHPNFPPYLRPFTKNESGSDNDKASALLSTGRDFGGTLCL